MWISFFYITLSCLYVIYSIADSMLPKSVIEYRCFCENLVLIHMVENSHRVEISVCLLEMLKN